MRTGSILFLLGILLLIQLPYLPPLALVALLPLAVLLLFKRSNWRWPAWLLCGFLWSLLRADFMLSDRLDRQLEGRQLLVEGRVVSLPEKFTTVMRFDLQVDRLADANGKDYQSPDTIRLNWYRSYPELRPGEYWRLHVKLKRPYGFMNPGGFDYEGFLFQAGFGATGYVVNSGNNVRLAGASDYYIHQVRFRIREMLERLLGDNPMLSLVAGLAIGDRSGITPQQWRILTNTGINHLLAISGLHIGMVAAFGFFITRWLWPLCRGMSGTVAGPRVATAVAAISALFYSALAGFSIPTQRTVIMLGVALLLTGFNRLTRSTNILALALIVSLYGTFGAFNSTSAPYFRRSFSTMTSIWICPMPERINSLVCVSRCMSMVGSSSISLCNPCDSFSSSALVFGSRAKEMRWVKRLSPSN